ncbi:nucleotide disphospho-sugar-binding domain-containing protein [Streptomyces echinoruber]|uniref:Glycosyl transferase n=1 Tax=Streptomyces echinoruber TaxID=68898 RepID=A0A918R2H1_9ACTN|nr:nucleotide disphospho-sugar-binding domain-containing protein [Streptomyces echinoruber]GGZ81798.1 glycosyl transferase [Streptomyces echinoruber]
MRVLLTTAPLHGHFFPTVPLAWALRAAGHQVLVACPEGFTGTVAGAGLPAVASAPHVGFEDFMLRDRDGRPLHPPRDPAERRRGSARAWGRLAARTLEGTLRIVGDWRPDLVLSEPLEYAGRLAAAAHGVPWVEAGVGLSDFADSRGPATEELAPEMARLGRDALPGPALVLDVRPPSLRGGGPARGPVVRYVPHNGADVRPAWLGLPRGGPRICLTLGSMLPRHGRLDFRGRLLALATALAGPDTEVVIAVDDEVAAGWERLPRGVVAAGRFPLDRALTGCDLLVSHGGAGSVCAALAHGVPQVCLPQTADQFENAGLVAAGGAGLALPSDASEETVRDAAHTVLERAAFRDRARALAEEIARQPSPVEVVPLLERLAAAPAGAGV